MRYNNGPFKVGILCAGDDELAPFLLELDPCRLTERAMLKFYEGRIHGVEAVALFSGVCKVNAAIAAQILIDQFDVSLIINAGTAGGIHPKLQLFDTVISAQVCYHDVAPDILTEFHPWMKSPFFEADPDLIRLSETAVSKCKPAGRVFWGRMVTGEAFISDAGRESIIERFDPLTVDMETAAIAHTCYVNGIPFLAIRCVTDTASHCGTAFFEENCAKAAGVAKDLTLALLDELGVRSRQARL